MPEANPPEGTDKGAQNGQSTPWDEWLNGQPEDVKTLYSGHIQGLKSALEKERTGRKADSDAHEADKTQLAALEKQLRDAATKLEEGSEARKSLEQLSTKLEEANRRADFFMKAQAAGVNNLRLAWLAVTQDGLFDRKGEPDIESLRKDYPELFVQEKPQGGTSGNAGSGTQSAPKAAGMNALIRQAAGR